MDELPTSWVEIQKLGGFRGGGFGAGLKSSNGKDGSPLGMMYGGT
jgi:hypothetical protein